MIRSNRTAREMLCNRSAIVKMIRPSVKFDLIFLYISRYETKSTSNNTTLPAVI